MDAIEKKEQSSRMRETPLDALSSYQIDSRVFVVEPVFYASGKETLGSVLLRLMKSELTKS